MPFPLTVRIVGGPGFGAFVPQGGGPGTPLVVRSGDSVSWGNGTPEPHLPWPVDPMTGQFLPHPFSPLLAQPIPPFLPSAAVVFQFQLQPGAPPITVPYRCAVHPLRNEFGSIILSP
jgi:hypothetical protein